MGAEMARPTQERALRTRELIVLAAAEEFDRNGYAGAAITKILERAGVTAGALYFHFKSKQELALEVMNAQPQTVVPHLASRGLQRLVDLTLIWSRQLREDVLLRAGVRLAVEQGGFGVQNLNAYQNWQGIMTDCLQAAEEDGQLRPGVDPDRTATFVVGACTGVQLYAELRNGREDLTEQVVQMWQLLLPGVAVADLADRIDLNPERGNSRGAQPAMG
ncbi:ScbR family autoregulator-binding transcription factor [Streptomyces sp. NPDC048211]|uniref:ScbR family autoregulator-binding transcription factor n=1 Tax=Streptomyces sp. NPDC048211 TaxID=3365516 RepID=UPI00372277EA